MSLTTLTTDQGSQDRFDHLSALLGDGIIGGIWLYSSLDLAAVEASVEALPLVIDALGLGCTRFLKVRSAASPRTPSIDISHRH